MAQKLKSISIAGYKSIREATVELRDLNVLIGANGAGKSNLLSAFGMVREMVEGRLGAYVARRGGANALLHFGRKVTERIKIKLDFDPNGYEALLAPTDVGGLFFENEQCWLHRDEQSEPFFVKLGSGYTESKLREPFWAVHFTKSWQVFHFHDVSENAPVKQQHSLGDHQFLRAEARNLAAFLYRLRNAEAEDDSYRNSYQRILRSIRLVDLVRLLRLPLRCAGHGRSPGEHDTAAEGAACPGRLRPGHRSTALCPLSRRARDRSVVVLRAGKFQLGFPRRLQVERAASHPRQGRLSGRDQRRLSHSTLTPHPRRVSGLPEGHHWSGGARGHRHRRDPPRVPTLPWLAGTARSCLWLNRPKARPSRAPQSARTMACRRKPPPERRRHACRRAGLRRGRDRRRGWETRRGCPRPSP